MGSSSSWMAGSYDNLFSLTKTKNIDKHSRTKQYQTDCYVDQRAERDHHIVIQTVNFSVNIFEHKTIKKKRIPRFLKKLYCIKGNKCGHKGSYNNNAVSRLDKFPEQESTSKQQVDHDNLSLESGFVDGNDSVRTAADGSDEVYYYTPDQNVNNFNNRKGRTAADGSDEIHYYTPNQSVNNFRNRNGTHSNNFVSPICQLHSRNSKLLLNLESSHKISTSLSSNEIRDRDTFEDSRSTDLNFLMFPVPTNYDNTQRKKTINNEWNIVEDFHGFNGLETQTGNPSTIGDDIANTLVDINSFLEESRTVISQNVKGCQEKVITVYTDRNVYGNNMHRNKMCHCSEMKLAENIIFNEDAITSNNVFRSVESNDDSSILNERFRSVHKRPDYVKEQQNKQEHFEQEISEASLIDSGLNVTPIALSNSNNVGNKDLILTNWQLASISDGNSHTLGSYCKRMHTQTHTPSCTDNDNKRAAHGNECKNQQKISLLDSDTELLTGKNKPPLPMSTLHKTCNQYKGSKKFAKFKLKKNWHLNSNKSKMLSMTSTLTSKSANKMTNEAHNLTVPEYSLSSYSSAWWYQSFKHLSRTRRKSYRLLGVKLRHRSKRYLHENQHIFSKLERQDFIKSLVKEIHPYIDTSDGLVLSKYFDLLTRGRQPPTREEQMSFEWLRLASFSNYQGNGNALALARNGFYQDSSQGPHATRCVHCGVTHSTWELFDDVIAEHCRMSPRCPMLSNNPAQPNVPIDETSTQTTIGNDGAGHASTAATNSSATATLNSTVTVDNLSNNLQNTSVFQTKQTPSSSYTRSQQPTDELEYAERQTCVPSTGNISAFGSTGTPYTGVMAPGENDVAGGSTTNAIGHSQMPSKANVTQCSDNKTSVSNLTINSADLVLGPGNERVDPTAGVVVTNPKHPDYRTLESRTNSYCKWPAYLDQTPRQMAEAGFYFTGDTDSTICFACGGGLRKWEPGDDPVLEHTRWFPQCEYINKLKGERYVQVVERRHREHMAERQRQQIELARTRAALQAPLDALNTRAGVVLREMGYTVDKIREAINAVRRQTGLSNVTSEQALKWILDDAEGQSEVTQQLPATNNESLRQENEKLRDMQTCKICMESSVDTTLMPCGHLVSCEPCAKRLRKCPICRKLINGTIKIFMS